MIQTFPLSYIHRDRLNRVIRKGDYVIWSNRKQGKGMDVCTVVGDTEETIRISKLDGRLTNVNPSNTIVITAQVERNVEGNVGANMDMEATR